MARSNKYPSVNFNEIFEKNLKNKVSPTVNSSFSSSGSAFVHQTKNLFSNSKINGHMLLLSRPAPSKPISTQPNTDNKEKGSPISIDQPPKDLSPENIYSAPQGRIGSDILLSSSPLVSPAKSDRFVPPHLRPGFVGKEENLGSDFVKGGPVSLRGKADFGGHRSGVAQGAGAIGSRPNRYGEETWSKSGGGYSLSAYPNRLGPSVTRPSSSG